MKKLKFYFRVDVLGIFNPYWINKCLAFDGWNVYRCDAISIVGDMTFTEIKI